MIKSTAFAPAHISGFFEPVYHPEDILRTGSRGAGVNLNVGAISEVSVDNSSSQIFEIFVNGKKINDPVMNLAMKYILEDNNLHVVVKTKLDLPIGQGFGMSAASALSSTLALTKILGLSSEDALKASHFAEVNLRTGLGDVISSFFGGFEIRKLPGLPPWGLIEHIPGDFDIVLCIIGNKIDTKKILEDKKKAIQISEYGKLCTKKILEKPSVENFLKLSLYFTNKTGLAEKKIICAINAANKHGMASMCMLGNSVFAIGKTDKLSKTLSNYGQVFVCRVDKGGARVLDG